MQTVCDTPDFLTSRIFFSIETTSMFKTFLLEARVEEMQWRTEGGLGVSNPPPKFRSFYKIKPDCKLSGKCLMFLFQHPD